MSLLLNWNQTELRVVFLLGGAMTKCPLTPHQMLITSPQPELKVYFVWGTVSAVYLRTCPWVDCFSLDVCFMPKSLYILWGFFVFVCTHCVCVPEVARCAQPLNHSVSVRNMYKHSVAQHEQRNFYISLRSVKPENRWFLTIAWLADLLVAPRRCGQLSTTETTPEPGCASLCGSGSIMLPRSTALCQESCSRDCWAARYCSRSVERRLGAALQCKAWVLCWRSDHAALLTPHPFSFFSFLSS